MIWQLLRLMQHCGLVSELARQLQSEPEAVQGMLGQLERGGYVRRQQIGQDCATQACAGCRLLGACHVDGGSVAVFAPVWFLTEKGKQAIAEDELD